MLHDEFLHEIQSQHSHMELLQRELDVKWKKLDDKRAALEAEKDMQNILRAIAYNVRRSIPSPKSTDDPEKWFLIRSRVETGIYTCSTVEEYIDEIVSPLYELIVPEIN